MNGKKLNIVLIHAKKAVALAKFVSPVRQPFSFPILFSFLPVSSVLQKPDLLPFGYSNLKLNQNVCLWG